jgi:hypothetical protein
MGYVMSGSISLQDTIIVNNAVVGQGNNVRAFAKCMNPVRPLVLNPEPLLVAESLIGSVGNDDHETSDHHPGDHFTKSLNMYKKSQTSDRELYNLVNERATVMININQKWFHSFVRLTLFLKKWTSELLIFVSKCLNIFSLSFYFIRYDFFKICQLVYVGCVINLKCI